MSNRYSNSSGTSNSSNDTTSSKSSHATRTTRSTRSTLSSTSSSLPNTNNTKKVVATMTATPSLASSKSSSKSTPDNKLPKKSKPEVAKPEPAKPLVTGKQGQPGQPGQQGQEKELKIDQTKDKQFSGCPENCKCRDKTQKRCHRCEHPKCACPELTIKLLNTAEHSIFDQEGRSYAKFSLGSCYSCLEIHVKTSVCVLDRWSPIVMKEHMRTNCQGNFNICLPPFVTDIMVSVKINYKECEKKDKCRNHDSLKNRCIKVKYVNSQTGSSPFSYLEGTDLSLILMCKQCNTEAINASGYDHKFAKEQLGPCRASRAIAIVQLAIFECIIAITGTYRSLFGIIPLTKKKLNIAISTEAAVAQALHDTLVYLFPTQTAACDKRLTEALELIEAGPARSRGTDIGRQVAKIVMDSRRDDNSKLPEQKVGPNPDEYHVTNLPGTWNIDPISKVPIALGSRWSEVKPFVLEKANMFRAPVPPALGSKEYAMAYNEVKALGGDGLVTPTVRSEDAQEVGIYWGYDGAPLLGTPPNLYNQIAMQLGLQMKLTPLEFARMLVLINVGMADAAIAAWETKYFYNVWRPVTAVRRANDPLLTPSQINPDVLADPNFTPLGAPASNTFNPDGTPPFSAYVSGHATFGGILFESLRSIFGKDDIPFTFVSHEYNGKTKDNQGRLRPLKPRSFMSLSQAEEENGQSRVYLGIHWNFDKTEGIAMGHKVAKYVMSRIYANRLPADP